MKLILPLVLMFSLSCFSKGVLGENKDEKPGVIGALFTPDPDQILGEILKGTLEKYHLTQKKLDNKLSKEAYKLYLEQLDYGKQFLTQTDLNELSKMKLEFDDQLISGDLSIVNTATKIFDKRIPLIQKHVKELLKKEIDFNSKEDYETDSKKRKFVKNIAALKERWRKMIKLEVLIEFFELKDEQDGVNKKKDEKKKTKQAKKSGPKLSKKQMVAKAKEKVDKRYSKVFKRLLEQKKSDKLVKFYNAITRVYDPHTLYLIPEEKADFDIDMSGKLEGIGALLSSCF